MGWFADKVAHTLQYQDANSRAKVDVGSTGFFLGREFRAYWEFKNLATATVQVFKVVAPVDFILLKQSIDLDSGGRDIRAYSAGGTPGGTFNVTVPNIGRNRMAGRPNYLQTGLPYVSQLQITTGGTFNIAGATEVDLLKARAATQNTSSANVISGGDDYRGLPAGTYYIVAGPLTGVTNTDNVNGKYEIVWEERPNGNQA